MAQLQSFPNCCGAQILTGLTPVVGVAGGIGGTNGVDLYPQADAFRYFTVAISNPDQSNYTPEMDVKLAELGFEPVVKFTGNSATRLTLWCRGRNWKPIAGAKGNMKEEVSPIARCTCKDVDYGTPLCSFCKAVRKEAKRLSSLSPRKPAGKKKTTRRTLSK